MSSRLRDRVARHYPMNAILVNFKTLNPELSMTTFNQLTAMINLWKHNFELGNEKFLRLEQMALIFEKPSPPSVSL